MVPGQTDVNPLIAVGVGGAETTLIAIVCGALLPQLLLAVTETVPPLPPARTVIDVVVELPLQPAGKLHVYEVAPVTGGIE